jgi:DUF1680 family protein
MRLRSTWFVAFTLFACRVVAQQNPQGLYNDPGTDLRTPLDPSEVHFEGGILGERFDVNANVRLLNLDENVLLEPFEQRDKEHQAWSGEHVGKYLHAAILTRRNNRDPKLRAKVDRVVRRLIATQEPDGYLGTYQEAEKWKDWDVWVHKYDLIGLLTYWQYTHYTPALTACRRVGDLLVRTFGTKPGQRDINLAGEHVGMAPCSVLEPMVLLYQATKDPRYLAFAQYIVKNYDAPTGPKIVSTLLNTGSVRKVANGKAYEMLSNFNGLAELDRAQGSFRPKSDLSMALLSAYKDVSLHRLNAIGGGSTYEVWNDDGDFPNEQNKDIGETCVTVTWEQLCLQLLRSGGDFSIGDDVERSIYNALLGAQREDGAAWDYYTSLHGVKPYSEDLTCCISSGARGIALLPSLSAFKNRWGDLNIVLYNPMEIRTRLPSGPMQLRLSGDYPYSGNIDITVNPSKRNQEMGLELRVPKWATSFDVSYSRDSFHLAIAGDGPGYIDSRAWIPGDHIYVKIGMKPRLVPGSGSNKGLVSVAYGPMVFAADTLNNPDVGDPGQLTLLNRPLTVAGTVHGPQRTFHLEGWALTGDRRVVPIKLVPFAVAGRDGKSRYAVWFKQDSAK